MLDEPVCDVVFRGRLVAGVEQARVEANLAKLFKIDPARARQLFSGKRVVLKKGVDKATAEKYRDVLKKAGAVVAIVSRMKEAPVPAQPDSPVRSETPAPSPQPAPEASAADPNEPGLAEPGAVLVSPVTQEPVQIDTSHMSLSQEGTAFDAVPQPLEPSFDLAGMDMESDFDALDDSPRAEAPEYDLGEMTVVESEDALDHTAKADPLDIDISHLSATEIVEPLDDSDPAPEPDIDISGLSAEVD